VFAREEIRTVENYAIKVAHCLFLVYGYIEETNSTKSERSGCEVSYADPKTGKGLDETPRNMKSYEPRVRILLKLLFF